MPKSFQYRGYVIKVDADWWYVGMYAGNYAITDAITGSLIQDTKKAVYRPNPDAACKAAVTAGQQYIDRLLARGTA